MNLKRPILIVQNNTGNQVPVTLFSGSPNASGSINAPRQYKWDITTLAVSQLTNLSLQVGTLGVPGFSTLSMAIASSSIAAIVAALNSLNVGFFQSVTSGASIFIVTNNKAFTFGNLLINQPTQVSHWITTGGLQVNALGVTSNASLLTNNLRSSTLVSSISASGSLTPPFSLPYIGNFPISPGLLINGDPLQVVIAVAPGGPYAIQLILKQNGVIILNSSQIGTSATFNFNWLFNSVYDFTATVN